MDEEGLPQAQCTLFLEYTDFAIARRDERRITDEEVRYALQNANHTYSNGNNTVFRVKLPGGRTLKVQTLSASENPAYVVDVIIF